MPCFIDETSANYIIIRIVRCYFCEVWISHLHNIYSFTLRQNSYKFSILNLNFKTIFHILQNFWKFYDILQNFWKFYSYLEFHDFYDFIPGCFPQFLVWQLKAIRRSFPLGQKNVHKFLDTVLIKINLIEWWNDTLNT